MITLKKTTIYTLIIVSFLAIVSFFIIRDFIVPLIFTGILVYLFHPAYKKMYKYIKNHFLTSLIMFILIGLIIVVPILFTISQVSNEFSMLKDANIEQSLIDASNVINEKYNTKIDLLEEYNKFIEITNTYLSDILYSKIPIFIFNIFIIMFFFYYFMKNYDKESSYFAIIVKNARDSKFNHKIQKLIHGIIYGQILVRFFQAFIGAICFFLIGLPGAFFWGILMFFAAFLPVFGTALVWGPLLFINIILKNYDMATYIFVIGMLVSTIDNVLFPIIVSEKANMGPIVTLISILGGLELFGIYGLILGPFFLGLFFLFLDELIFIYNLDNSRKSRKFIWTDNERAKYNSLKTTEARKEFERMLDKKYEQELEKQVSSELKA